MREGYCRRKGERSEGWREKKTNRYWSELETIIQIWLSPSSKITAAREVNEGLIRKRHFISNLCVSLAYGVPKANNSEYLIKCLFEGVYSKKYHCEK